MINIETKNIQFGSILKKIRKSKDMTQKELAKKIGVQYTYISKIERNEVKPNIDKVIAIKKALSISGNEMLGEVDNSITGRLRRKFEQVNKFSEKEQEYIMVTIDLVMTKNIVKFANPETMDDDDYWETKKEIREIEYDLHELEEQKQKEKKQKQINEYIKIGQREILNKIKKDPNLLKTLKV